MHAFYLRSCDGQQAFNPRHVCMQSIYDRAMDSKHSTHGMYACMAIYDLAKKRTDGPLGERIMGTMLVLCAMFEEVCGIE